MAKQEQEKNRELCDAPLFTLLCGTFPKPSNRSALQVLHGQADVLR